MGPVGPSSPSKDLSAILKTLLRLFELSKAVSILKSSRGTDRNSMIFAILLRKNEEALLKTMETIKEKVIRVKEKEKGTSVITKILQMGVTQTPALREKNQKDIRDFVKIKKYQGEDVSRLQAVMRSLPDEFVFGVLSGEFGPYYVYQKQETASRAKNYPTPL